MSKSHAASECLMAGSILLRLIENIPDNEPVSVHQLTCKSGLNYRTIRKYLHVISEIQEARKVVREQVGLQIFVKKA